MTLPPCPIEGCMSQSDHHWHPYGKAEKEEEGNCFHSGLCQNIEPEVRCYSSAVPSQKAVPMLSVETVAVMIRAAEDLAYRRGLEDGWNDCEGYYF